MFRVGDTGGKLDFDDVLKVLAGEGITRLMVEGGPKLAGAMAAAGLVDELALLRGGNDHRRRRHRCARGLPLDGFTGQLQARGRETLGPDVLETYART